MNLLSPRPAQPPVCQERWILAGVLMAYFKLQGMERGASRAESRTLPLRATWGCRACRFLPPGASGHLPWEEGTGVGGRAVLEKSRRGSSQLHGGPTCAGRLVSHFALRCCDCRMSQLLPYPICSPAWKTGAYVDLSCLSKCSRDLENGSQHVWDIS